MAALLGTTKQVISRYETKKRIPRLSVVTAFAQKLGLPVAALPARSRFSAAGADARFRQAARPDSGQRGPAASRSTAPATDGLHHRGG